MAIFMVNLEICFWKWRFGRWFHFPSGKAIDDFESHLGEATEKFERNRGKFERVARCIRGGELLGDVRVWLVGCKQKESLLHPKNGGMPKCTRRRICTSTFCITQKSFDRKYQNASFEEVDRISWSILSDKYDVSEVLTLVKCDPRIFRNTFW